jgi:V/A-type H+-transporting ATPase subunit A
MMKVVGEEGTSLDDYVVYLKGEFLDAVYLQQNSFDAVDCAVAPERQRHVFGLVIEILASEIRASDKEDARSWFYKLRQLFLDYNGAEWRSERFASLEGEMRALLADRAKGIARRGARLVERLE